MRCAANGGEVAANRMANCMKPRMPPRMMCWWRAPGLALVEDVARQHGVKLNEAVNVADLVRELVV